MPHPSTLFAASLESARAGSMPSEITLQLSIILSVKRDKSPGFGQLLAVISPFSPKHAAQGSMNSALDLARARVQISAGGRNGGMAQGSLHQMNRPTRSRCCRPRAAASAPPPLLPVTWGTQGRRQPQKAPGSSGAASCFWATALDHSPGECFKHQPTTTFLGQKRAQVASGQPGWYFGLVRDHKAATPRCSARNGKDCQNSRNPLAISGLADSGQLGLPRRHDWATM